MIQSITHTDVMFQSIPQTNIMIQSITHTDVVIQSITHTDIMIQSITHTDVMIQLISTVASASSLNFCSRSNLSLGAVAKYCLWLSEYFFSTSMMSLKVQSCHLKLNLSRSSWRCDISGTISTGSFCSRSGHCMSLQIRAPRSANQPPYFGWILTPWIFWRKC